MNMRIFNRTVLAITLVSLFSGFSSFAVMKPQKHKAGVPLRSELRAELVHPAPMLEQEFLGFFNTTNQPVFLRGHHFAEITPFLQVNPDSSFYWNITNKWITNPDPTIATEFPEIYEYTLATSVGPLGTVRFLINAQTEKARVVLNIGSYDKVYNFDFSEAGDIAFTLTLTDDPIKPVDFELQAVFAPEGQQVLRRGKVFSEEEKLQEIERQRLLKMPEAKFDIENIMQLPLWQRR